MYKNALTFPKSSIDSLYDILFFFLVIVADVTPMNFEAPLSLKSCSKAIILVCTFLTYYLFFGFLLYIFMSSIVFLSPFRSLHCSMEVIGAT